MDKQLRNKSAPFVFTEVRNTSKPGDNFCSFRQLAHSKQHAWGWDTGREERPLHPLSSWYVGQITRHGEVLPHAFLWFQG